MPVWRVVGVVGIAVVVGCGVACGAAPTAVGRGASVPCPAGEPSVMAPASRSPASAPARGGAPRPASSPTKAAADEATWDLPYPPATPPRPGAIVHVATGLELTFAQALDLVAAARLVCIGESHDNPAAHRVEHEVIRGLQRRFPGQVAIGMEMFRTTQQPALDRWTRGELSWTEFLRESRWYSEWGSDSRYYRDILELARRHHLDVVALNPSRELQQQVRRVGLDGLPATLRAQLPELGPPDPLQRAALKAIFGAHAHGGGGFEAFVRVQELWEESMAARVVGYLTSARGRGKRMVTVTGGWHVKYGFGLPKRALRRHPLPYVVVLARETSVPADKQDRIMHYELPPIPLRPADLVFMVAYEDLPGGGWLGVRLADGDGAVLEAVTPGSPAARAGLAPGDRVVAVGGRTVRDRTDLMVALEGQAPGTELALVVERPGGRRAAVVRLAGKPAPASAPGTSK